MKCVVQRFVVKTVLFGFFVQEVSVSNIAFNVVIKGGTEFFVLQVLNVQRTPVGMTVEDLDYIF